MNMKNANNIYVVADFCYFFSILHLCEENHWGWYGSVARDFGKQVVVLNTKFPKTSSAQDITGKEEKVQGFICIKRSLKKAEMNN